jgi:hypothetical protein
LALKAFKTARASDFSFRISTSVYLVASSIKRMKCGLLLSEGTSIDLRISEWISSRGYC